MARKKQRRKAPERSKASELPSGFQRVASPKTRLKPIFAVLTEVARAGDVALSETLDDRSPLARFDAGMLMRAVNAIKAIGLLLGDAHWEFAAPAARQLFELVVNAEHLGREDDREQATLRYALFGMLQMAQHEQKSTAYDAKTGRPINEERRQVIDAMLGGEMFAAFRVEKPGKAPRWQSSWAGKNTRELAALSSNRLRLDQYTLLFSRWSEEAHGSPGALLEGLMPPLSGRGPGEIVESDDRQIIELAAMATALFIELWELLPALPAFDRRQHAAWMQRIMTVAIAHGAAPPPSAETRADED